MKAVALRDLRTLPPEARVREETPRTANNGRPVAAAPPADARTGAVDETLDAVR